MRIVAHRRLTSIHGQQHSDYLPHFSAATASLTLLHPILPVLFQRNTSCFHTRVPMPGPVTLLLSAAACLVLALWAANQTSAPFSFQLPFLTTVCHDLASLSRYQASAPYSPSWTSWWNHNRHVAVDGSPSGTAGTGQGGGSIGKDWNILYHLGGNGPWIEKVDGVLEGGIAVPAGCTVEQVHMVS